MSHSTGSNATILSRKHKITFAEALKRIREGKEIVSEEDRNKYSRTKKQANASSWNFITQPPPPKMPPKMKQADWKSLIAKLASRLKDNRVSMVESPVVNKEVYISQPAFVNVGANVEINGLFQAEAIRLGHEEEVTAILEHAQKMMLTSGTSQGLAKRILEGATLVTKVATFTADPAETAKHFPWSEAKWLKHLKNHFSEAELIEMFGEDQSNWSKLGVEAVGGKGSPYTPTWVSDAGLPFPDRKKSDPEAMEHAYEITNTLLKIANSNTGFKDLMKWYEQNHRTDGQFLVKNKLEVRERADYIEAVRAYFVVPFGLSLMFSMIWDFIGAGLENSFENSDSFSMIGFSWANGGADTLVERLKDLGDGKVLIFSYSDDLHIGVRLSSGQLYVITPDVRKLDLGLQGKNDSYRASVILNMLHGRVDLCFQNLIRFACVLATNGIIAFPEGVSAQIDKILRSGIPGTSYLGTIDVATMAQDCFRLEALMDDHALTEAIDKAEKRAREKYGMTFKEGTLEAHPFDPENYDEGEVTPFKILGQNLVSTIQELDPKESKDREKVQVFLPLPPMEHIGAAMVLASPGVGVKLPHERWAKTTTAVMGLTVSGGWYYDITYKVAQTYWNLHTDPQHPNGPTLPSFLDEDTGSVDTPMGYEDGFEELFSFAIKDGHLFKFPPKEFFENILLPEYCKKPVEIEYHLEGDLDSVTKAGLFFASLDSSAEEEDDASGDQRTEVKPGRFSWADETDEEERKAAALLEKKKNLEKKAIVAQKPTLKPRPPDVHKTLTEKLDVKRIPEKYVAQTLPAPETAAKDAKRKAERAKVQEHKAWVAKTAKETKEAADQKPNERAKKGPSKPGKRDFKHERDEDEDEERKEDEHVEIQANRILRLMEVAGKARDLQKGEAAAKWDKKMADLEKELEELYK